MRMELTRFQGLTLRLGALAPTYERMMKTVNYQKQPDRSLGQSILSWITFAKRSDCDANLLAKDPSLRLVSKPKYVLYIYVVDNYSGVT